MESKTYYGIFELAHGSEFIPENLVIYDPDLNEIVAEYQKRYTDRKEYGIFAFKRLFDKERQQPSQGMIVKSSASDWDKDVVFTIHFDEDKEPAYAFISETEARNKFNAWVDFYKGLGTYSTIELKAGIYSPERNFIEYQTLESEAL